MSQITTLKDVGIIEKSIRKLKEKDRRKLVDRLVNEDFETAVQAFRANIKKQKLSAKDIDKIIEEARQEYYDKSRR